MRLQYLALLAICLISLYGAQGDSSLLGYGVDSDKTGYMEQEYGFTKDNLDARLKYVLDVASQSADGDSTQSLPSPKTSLNDLVDDIKDGGIVYPIMSL